MKNARLSKWMLATLVLSPVAAASVPAAIAAGTANFNGGTTLLVSPGGSVSINASGTDYNSGSVSASVYDSVYNSVYNSVYSSVYTGNANVDGNGNFALNMQMPTTAGQYAVKLSEDGKDDVSVAGSVYVVNSTFAFNGFVDADGMAQATVDSAKTVSEIQALQTTPQYFAFSMDKLPATSGVALSVYSDVVNAAVAKSGPAASFLIGTPFGDYQLPVGGLNLANGSKVTVTLTKPSASAMQTIQNAISAGYSITGTPVDFEASSTDAAGKSTPISFDNTYVSRSVYQNVTTPANTVGVMVTADGKLMPVPTLFVQKPDGTYYARLTHTENGVFALVTGTKTFSDINMWAKPDIENMASHLLVNGKELNLFKPADNISRAEFAALVVRSLGLSDRSGTNGFADVQSSDWFAKDVSIAAANGIVKGFDGKFNPNDQISREDMALMITRAMAFANKPITGSGNLSQFNDAGSIDSWSTSALAASVQAGIIKGDNNNIRPRDNATRAEAVVMLERMMRNLGFMN